MTSTPPDDAIEQLAGTPQGGRFRPSSATPPDDLSKLGRESGCKPGGGDISATEGVQTRAVEEIIGHFLYGRSQPGTHREVVTRAVATAIRSLTEERDRLRDLLGSIRRFCGTPEINDADARQSIRMRIDDFTRDNEQLP